jgi:hypothetical protein
MKLFFTIFISFTLSFTVFSQGYSKKELRHKPANLIEAVEQLKKIQNDSLKQKITSISERDFLSNSRALGIWIRNKWGLWKGKKLSKYFNALGIFNPDDMSSIILTSYYRELKGLDWRLDEQIQFYINDWNNQKKKAEVEIAP